LDPRTRTILKSLDTGSRGHYFIPDEEIRFPDARIFVRSASGRRNYNNKQWTTLAENIRYYRPARKGLRFTDKTYFHIRTVLIPRMQRDIERRAHRIVELRIPPIGLAD
jgi:hypothetical protein